MTQRDPPCPGSPRRSRRRAFTLIEALVTIIVLGLMVPPSVVVMRDAITARQEAVCITRATWLANAVIEAVIADVSSPDATLGMSALADADAYLNTPVTGLNARLSTLTAFYADFGLTPAVTIGALAGTNGIPTGDASRDVYRYVRVTVSWSSPRGGTKSLDIGALLTDLTQ